MKRLIIVAPISDSLINFRGDLIQDIKNKGYEFRSIRSYNGNDRQSKCNE